MFCLCFLTRRQPQGGASCALLACLAHQPVSHPQASSPVKHPDREAGLSLKGDWLHKVVSDLYSCHGMCALQIIIVF